MKTHSKLDQYINSHPRECLQLLVIAFLMIWQTPVAILGVITFLLSRTYKCKPWWLLGFGIALAITTLLFTEIKTFLLQGFILNRLLWLTLWHGQIQHVFVLLWNYSLLYLLGFTVFAASLLAVLELLPNSPHEKSFQSLKRRKLHTSNLIPDKRLQRQLLRFNDHQTAGTLLGVSKSTGQAVIIPDQAINQVMLVLGTTGAGKTITLRRFYQRALLQQYPLIIVDGKPTKDSIAWIEAMAAKHQRPFYGFNCGNFYHYDPLAHGGYTELKDKIISLKDQWENDYYKSIAEDYLQTTFEVLLKSGTPFDLQRVVECLNYPELILLARTLSDKTLMQRVKNLERYETKDITGLQAHLNLLIHSELGEFFKINETTFNLEQIIQNNGVVYFALPALRFPTFSKVLGKLIINDIKAVIDRETMDAHPAQKIMTVFDEFSVFAGEQVLNLVNMGRGKGIHAIFGTQGLADLKKVDETFESQVLNCTNTIICHRLNDQDSAEKVAAWAGTQETFNVTAQISMEGHSGMGSVRQTKEFIVHPDSIKQSLAPGEAFYITKVGGFRIERVRVKYSR